jgi:hypothetical protein
MLCSVLLLLLLLLVLLSACRKRTRALCAPAPKHPLPHLANRRPLTPTLPLPSPHPARSPVSHSPQLRLASTIHHLHRHHLSVSGSSTAFILTTPASSPAGAATPPSLAPFNLQLELSLSPTPIPHQLQLVLFL